MAASMLPILALSITHKVEQYGAYAGFASVLGLAVLSLLYFAQAREVKRLREWAGRAPERAAELQDRVQADAQRRAAAPPPAAQAQPAQAPRPAGALGAAPGAAPSPATPAAQAQQQGPPGTPAASGVAAPATAAAAASAPAQAAANQPTTIQPAAGAPGGAPGNGVPSPPPARPGQPLRVAPGSPQAPARPAAGSVSARSLGAPPASEGRSRGTILAIAGAVTAVVVVGLLLVFVVFGGGSGGGSRRARSTSPTAVAPGGGDGASTNGHATTTPVSPSSFVTSVLNGTTVTGLAQGVANRLQNAHFRTGTITNALNQTRSQTLVEYTPGHRAEGMLVAKAIDVKADAVLPASAGSRTIAGQQASVIVTVGADQNQPPQQ